MCSILPIALNVSTMQYKIFKGNNQYSHLNACVGNNGWTGMKTYVEGYQAATIAMLESVINKTQLKGSNIILWTEDTAVYPILFTARHSLELFLKDQILNINHLKENTPPIQKQQIITHNIKELWDLLKDQILLVNDTRINPIIEKLEETIIEYSHIDHNGECFRYPDSNDDQKHLEELSTINLYDFYQKYLALANEMQEFDFIIDYLSNEYGVSTYTKKLSRKDILDISKSLPPKHAWSNMDFKSVKEELKKKYRISSNELATAIDMIKVHYEFNLNIQPNNYMLDIDKDLLIKYCNGLLGEHELEQVDFEVLVTLRALIETKNRGYPFFSEWIKSYQKEYKELDPAHEITYISLNFKKVKSLLTDSLNYHFLFN